MSEHVALIRGESILERLHVLNRQSATPLLFHSTPLQLNDIEPRRCRYVYLEDSMYHRDSLHGSADGTRHKLTYI